MNNIFHDLLDESVIIYIDDIFIYSKTPKDYYQHLDEVLKRL